MMNYKDYERILNNIITQAPLECGVQTLVFMLLDEVIYNTYGNEVKVLVADLRDKECIYAGATSVPDLCIVKKDFKYVKKGEEQALADQKNKRLGCVEVKFVNKDLLKNIKQLVGHIVNYKKVLCTDGLMWRYYCPTQEQFQAIEKALNTFEQKEENLVKVNGIREILEQTLKNADSWQVVIGKKSSKEENIEINESSYIELRKNISNIRWMHEDL